MDKPAYVSQDGSSYSAVPSFETLLRREGAVSAVIQRVPPAAPDYLVQLPPVPWHTLVVALEARGQRYEGRHAGAAVAFRVRPDHLTLLPAAADSHWHGQTGRDALLALNLDVAWLERLAADHGLPAMAAALRPRFGHRDPGIAPMAAALRAQRMVGPLSPDYVDHWATLAALRLLRFAAPPREPGALDPRRLATVREFIEAHLEDDLPLARLAAQAGMSTFHFARAFRRSTGVPPHAYVLSRRVERAKRLMCETELGLAEIALACGFASQSHFTTAFRQCVGASPGRWRVGSG